MPLPTNAACRPRADAARSQHYAWITFTELARHLGLQPRSSRWLERRLLDTEWQAQLMIERVAVHHRRRLPTPPRGDLPWVMSRTLVDLHRVDLRHFLFG